MRDEMEGVPLVKGGQGRSDREVEEAGENTFWLILMVVILVVLLLLFGGA